MVCNLTREFSQKTKSERNKIYLHLLSSPVMHTDFTFGRMNGKQASVLICANSDMALYQGKETKGGKGMEGSPLELYEEPSWVIMKQHSLNMDPDIKNVLYM